MNAAHYDLFGRRITVICDAGVESVGPFIAQRWKDFQTTAAEPPAQSGAHVVFHLHEGTAGRLREWQFFNNGRLLVIADDRRLITGAFDRPPWQIHIEASGRTVEETYYYLFEPLLLMTLARLNLVHWHSAAVRLNGGAVLLAGPSGSGKSTTTLTFLESGYTFVADDEIFLEHGPAGIASLGVDHDLYATDDTLAMFPRLDHLKSAPLVRRGHGLKRRVPVRDVYGTLPDEAAPPLVRVVLFPHVSASGRTDLQPISAGEAVRRFMAHKPKEYPTFVTDEPAAQRRLDTYAALAHTARCFDVNLGRDAASLPERVRAHVQ
jgi:hypothetical protein